MTEKIYAFSIFSDIPARDMVKLTSVKVTYEDINCIKYRRIIYMSWDNMLGMYNSALYFIHYAYEKQIE